MTFFSLKVPTYTRLVPRPTITTVKPWLLVHVPSQREHMLKNIWTSSQTVSKCLLKVFGLKVSLKLEWRDRFWVLKFFPSSLFCSLCTSLLQKQAVGPIENIFIPLKFNDDQLHRSVCMVLVSGWKVIGSNLDLGSYMARY